MLKMFRPKVIGATVIGAAVGFSTNYALTKILFKPEQPLKINGKTIPYVQGLLPATQPAVADAAERVINAIVHNPKYLAQAQDLLTKPQVKDAVLNFLIKLIYETADKKSINEILSLFLSDEKKDSIRESLKEFIGKILVEKTDKEFLGNLITNEGIKIFKEVTAGSVISKLMNEKLFAAIADAISVAVHKFVETSATEKILDVVFMEVDSLMDMTIPALLKQFTLDEVKMKSLLDSGYDALIMDIIPKLLENVELGLMVKNLILKIDYSKIENFLNTKCKKVLLGFDALGAVSGGLTANLLVGYAI